MGWCSDTAGSWRSSVGSIDRRGRGRRAQGARPPRNGSHGSATPAGNPCSAPAALWNAGQVLLAFWKSPFPLNAQSVTAAWIPHLFTFPPFHIFKASPGRDYQKSQVTPSKECHGICPCIALLVCWFYSLFSQFWKHCSLLFAMRNTHSSNRKPEDWVVKQTVELNLERTLLKLLKRPKKWQRKMPCISDS